MGHFRKQMVSILLTTRCNMNCAYCITSSNFFKTIDIDINFAMKGIKDYFEHTKYPYVRFVALGEPTQNFKALKQLYEYARRLSHGQAKFELQTNGFFNAHTASWIAGHIDQVWLSFDGLPQIHDKLKRSKTGGPTSQKILENSRIMQEKTSVGFRTTITSLNVQRQEEMVRFACNHGIKAIFSKLMLPPANFSPEHGFYRLKGTLETDIMEYAKYFVKSWKLARKLGIFIGNGYINNFDEICEFACRACAPCPHLTPDGYVSACDRATQGQTALQEFIYGRYNLAKKSIEYDNEKIKLLRDRSVYNMVQCSDCDIKFRCAGGCLGTCAQISGSMFKIIPSYCRAIKYMYKNIDWDPRDGLFPYYMT